jgi:hypothetical protein
MLISTSHRFIFIHIMKTAGTSVTECLAPTVRWNDVVLGGLPFGEAIEPAYRRQFGISKHAPARAVRDLVGAAAWDTFFSFTFVRNPYARARSVYTWIRRTLRTAAADDAAWGWPVSRAFAASDGFAGFIRHPEFQRSVAAAPQVDAVDDADGSRLVGFVGRVEDIDAGMAEVCRRIGIPFAGLPVANPSEPGGGAAAVPIAATDYDYLAALYRDDFTAFGYDPRRHA